MHQAASEMEQNNNVPRDLTPFIIKYDEYEEYIKNITLELKQKDLDLVSLSRCFKINYCVCYSELHARSVLDFIKECDSGCNAIQQTNLDRDSDFFSHLYSFVKDIKIHQDKEEKIIKHKIDSFTTKLSNSSSPYISKKHMYKWREAFSFYKQQELWSKNCDPKEIAKKLCKFEQHIKNKTNLENEFILINHMILNQATITYINNSLIEKIITKHDIVTHLTAHSYIQLLNLNNNHFEILTIAVENQILSLIPQPEDYTCPICYDIAYKPIRLNCKHVFCVRCTIKLKQTASPHCPICRALNAIENANEHNLDNALLNMMNMYFPQEIKQKIKTNEREKMNEMIIHMYNR